MRYVEKYSPIELINDFDISFEAACNAYNHAERRLRYNKQELDDFEKEFIAEYVESVK